MPKLRILMEAELEVSAAGGEPEAENLGITAHAFAHHLKDSTVWNTTFETLPTGDALPGNLTVYRIAQVNEEGREVDTWSHPSDKYALTDEYGSFDSPEDDDEDEEHEELGAPDDEPHTA